MATFTDKNGKKWFVNINIGVLRALRDCGINLLSPDFATRLEQDTLLLLDILAVVCKQQRTADGVTDDDFFAAFNGDVLLDAASAVMEALADFFPSRKSQLLNELNKLKTEQLGTQ